MTGATSRVPAIPTMPHMLFALCGLLGLLPCTELIGPARYFLLLGPRHSQRVRRRRPGDHRTGADIGAVTDADRRHQRRVRTDEGALADIGVMLVEAIVIAGNGTSSDICTRADAGIAKVGQIVGLGALFNAAVLHLDKIADMDVFLDHRAGPQTGI